MKKPTLLSSNLILYIVVMSSLMFSFSTFLIKVVNRPTVNRPTIYDQFTHPVLPFHTSVFRHTTPWHINKIDTDIKTLVMTNRIEEGRPEYEYYQRNKDTSGTLWDLEYKDVMNNLSKSMTFFQTFWQESYGLTTLEALSRGVPVILNTRYDYHAAETIQSKYFWSFWKQNHCSRCGCQRNRYPGVAQSFCY